MQPRFRGKSPAPNNSVKTICHINPTRGPSASALNISIRSEARTGRYAVTGGFIIAGEVNRTVRSAGDVTGTRPGEECVLTAPL